MKKNKWFLNGGRGSGRTIRLLCETYENKIAELEAQIEKMKCLLNEIYSEYGFSELVQIRNNLPIEIQEVIKEIKENG